MIEKLRCDILRGSEGQGGQRPNPYSRGDMTVRDVPKTLNVSPHSIA